MALSQKGAIYKGREALTSPASSLDDHRRHILTATDDLASQLAVIRQQGNFGREGAPSAPHQISSIAVVNAGGFAQVTLTHNNAPPGVKYILQFSTSKNFLNPITVDNGESLSWQQFLSGLTLHFRAAPKFPSSPLAPWIYFGGASNPTAVAF